MKYVADFETNNAENIYYTEVWLAGLLSEDYKEKYIVKSINSFFSICFNVLESGSVIYFHNLSFDGSFILDWLERNNFTKNLGFYKEKFDKFEFKNFYWKNLEGMPDNSYKCFISRRGLWYDIIVKSKNKIIRFKDSYKLIPMSLRDMCIALDVEHKKLNMDYKKNRKSYGEITKEEENYFLHDLYGLAECLNLVWKQGLVKNTIGSCCLSTFKRMYGWYEFRIDFPQLYDEFLGTLDGISTGEFIRRSYYGGFILVADDKKCKLQKNGWTIDVTSLYAYIMHSMSGVKYCHGNGKYGIGKCKKLPAMYYYQRFSCKFKLKKGKIPFVKIRNTYLFSKRECLKSSEIEVDGKKELATVYLTYTQSELELFLENYEVYDMNYIDYIQFYTMKGIFDEYVDKYFKLKNEAKNKAERLEAKMMLVNLYGKFATKTDSSFKIPYYNKDKDCISFYEQEENKMVGGYIAIGSQIVSEARVYQIRNCQKVYDRGDFCYSDTDSIHGTGNLPEDIEIADNKLGAYKLESRWSDGFFQSGKRYIEKIIEENGKSVVPYYNIVASGLPDRGKNLLRVSMNDSNKEEILKELGDLTELEQKFIDKERKITDFDVGIKIPGKLGVKRIKGGIILEETEFSIL